MKDFSKEIKFIYSRSRGKGGQNVNKVETKVELCFNINDSVLLTDDEKNTLKQKLANRIDLEGVLHITSQTERTQLGNKKKVVERFNKMVCNALTKQKARFRTQPTTISQEKRLESKKKQSKKKRERKNTITLQFE